MRSDIGLLSLAAWLCLIPRVTSAYVPPEFIELTPQKIKAMGFTYTIWKKGSFSYIHLDAPQRIDGGLTPHSTEVITHDLHGNLLEHASGSTSRERPWIGSRYNHQQVDVSISIAFCATPVASCKDFGIASVSSFIKNYAKAADLLRE